MPENGDQQSEPGPDQGRDVQFHLCPGQNESAQALQDLGNRQPEDNREEDGEIVKGVHGSMLALTLLQTNPAPSRWSIPHGHSGSSEKFWKT
jgi:hypothetical protein